MRARVCRLKCKDKCKIVYFLYRSIWQLIELLLLLLLSMIMYFVRRQPSFSFGLHKHNRPYIVKVPSVCVCVRETYVIEHQYI